MSFLTARTNIFLGIYFISLKETRHTNLERLSIQNWTSVKRWEKYLSRKTNFNTFWKLVALI